MAISKVTLNGVTLMDVTSDTVEANTLLSGNTATKNDGTKVTGSYTPATPMYQEKTISPTTSVQVVTPDTTYDALSQVTVNAIPSEYVVPTGTLPVTQNGTVNVKNYEYISVNVEGGTDMFYQIELTNPTDIEIDGSSWVRYDCNKSEQNILDALENGKILIVTTTENDTAYSNIFNAYPEGSFASWEMNSIYLDSHGVHQGKTIYRTYSAYESYGSQFTDYHVYISFENTQYPSVG